MPTIALVLAFLLMAGCAEEPQHLTDSAKPGFRADSWDDQLRQRTLRQGEAGRIYH